MDFYQSPYNYLILFGLIITVVFGVYLLARTNIGQSYIKEHLPLHFRGVGLSAIIFALVYSSFFVDISNLRSEAAVKMISLDNDVSFLAESLPNIDKDHSQVLDQYGELKRYLDLEDLKRLDTATKLSDAQSLAQRIKASLDSLEYRFNLSRYSGYTGNYSNLANLNPNPDAFDEKMAYLGESIKEIENSKRLIEGVYARKKDELNIVSHQLDALQKSNYTENIFYAMRALSLGALGALVTLIATNIIGIQKIEKSIGLFKLSNYWSLLISHAFLGAVISVVIFGLFYTKQLTIFQPDNTTGTNSTPPEFWRVTMLCILAGAFAEKLYSAASHKVDQYVDEDKKKDI